METLTSARLNPGARVHHKQRLVDRQPDKNTTVFIKAALGVMCMGSSELLSGSFAWADLGDLGFMCMGSSGQLQGSCASVGQSEGQWTP